MLKFKDIVRYVCATVLYLYKYLKNLLKMESVYDAARPFMLVAGIFGIGGNTICEIDGARSVRNSGLSLIIAVLITLVFTPTCFIYSFCELFSGQQRAIARSTGLILFIGRHIFTISTTAVTCIRTHFYCKNLTKVLQILNNTDMMLKQENIHVNYWKIVLKTVLFGLITCNYLEVGVAVNGALWEYGVFISVYKIVRVFIYIGCDSYFMWVMLFLLIIRERFVGLNKLLLQNAQLPNIMQDDSLLRRISLARDIHEQLSDAIDLFSDISRFVIIGVLVPGILQSLMYAIAVAMSWNKSGLIGEHTNMMLILPKYAYSVVVPIMKIVVLIVVCEGHKNNRGVLAARLRHLISREEDPRTVHELKQYILFNHDTVAGLVDLQLVDVDFTLLFTVIDFMVSYLFVIWSYVRPSKQGETMS